MRETELLFARMSRRLRPGISALNFLNNSRRLPAVFHPSQARNKHATDVGKFEGFRGDKAWQNGDNRINPCLQISFGTRVEEISSVIASRSSLLAVASVAGL